MHYTGFFIDAFRRWARIARERPIDTNAPDDGKIIVIGHQANDCVHQAALRLEGDPTLYRLIVAPANAQISVNGRPIDEHFIAPLEE